MPPNLDSQAGAGENERNGYVTNAFAHETQHRDQIVDVVQQLNQPLHWDYQRTMDSNGPPFFASLELASESSAASSVDCFA